jgi:hypothetical protein
VPAQPRERGQTPTAEAVQVTPPPAPVEERRAETTPPVEYRGPPTGRLVWTGDLGANSQLVIDGKQPSIGSVSSELPGVPVRIQLFSPGVRMIEAPSPENRWKRLVIASGEGGPIRSILIRWEVIR